MQKNTGHIDFALKPKEIRQCVACGKVAGTWADYPSVTPAGRYTIQGLVGICKECEYSYDREERWREIVKNWRSAAPPFIQLWPRTRMQLVARGRCEDEALAQVIKETLAKVPQRSRQKIVDYVHTDYAYSTTGMGMRFEALDRWPGMGEVVGCNMDWGHAIRLRASHCRRGGDGLVTTIAHELAHTEQRAEGKRFETEDECERDVEARLQTWGFPCGATAEDRSTMQGILDDVIREATWLRESVQRWKLPSSNYVTVAIRQVERAVACLDRAGARWRGRKGR
jgi:hypothetical protein